MVSQPVGVAFGEANDGFAGHVMKYALQDQLARPRLPQARRLLLRLAYDGTPGSRTDCPDLGGWAAGGRGGSLGWGQHRTAAS